MRSVPCTTGEPVCLQCSGYTVLPLNSSLYHAARRLERVIEHPVYANPDIHRPGFYEIDLIGGWAYIHVRDEARVVYLIAYGDDHIKEGLFRKAVADPLGAQDDSSILEIT